LATSEADRETVDSRCSRFVVLSSSTSKEETVEYMLLIYEVRPVLPVGAEVPAG